MNWLAEKAGPAPSRPKQEVEFLTAKKNLNVFFKHQNAVFLPAGVKIKNLKNKQWNKNIIAP